LSSIRGAEAPLPRPVAPAGLWVVEQQLGCPIRETHMTKTSKKPPIAGASDRKSSKRRASVTKPAAASGAQTAAPLSKAPSKQQQLAALVVRDEGATLQQMIAATGWLPHTTRAALTGLKKRGYVISSDKVDGIRTYRAVAPE